jgi:cytosine/uracil/thiamine/allantoin permease
MGIDFKPKSLLAFIVGLSLAVYYYGVYTNNQQLVNAALPALYLFGSFFVFFLALTLYRNVRKL